MTETYYRDFRDGEEHRYAADLVKSQLPQFYIEEAPLFVKLLEEYYEFLHKGGNPESVAKNLPKLNDIDELDKFKQKFLADSGGTYTTANTAFVSSANTFLSDVQDLYRREHLLNFPKNTQSFEIFIKNILDFYRTKGTERGTQIALRGIFNLESEVNRPFEQTLKPSDSTFGFDEYIQTIYESKLEKLIGTRIYGRASEANAIVQRITKKLVNGEIIAQLVVSDASSKQFENNETIFSLDHPDVEFKAIAGISRLVLTANGSEFTPGDILDLEGDGIEARVAVATVDSFNGRLSFSLINGGGGYRANSIVNIIGGNGGSGAALRIGAIGLTDNRIEIIGNEQVGFLASNSNILIGGSANSQISNNEFFANGQVSSVQIYTNDPIAGPNVANGLNVSWSAAANTITLESDVANNTFTNGTVWYIGNTTPGPDGNHGADGGMTVHDYDPGTGVITFTSQTSAAASTNTAVIREYSANVIYTGSANLASANVSNTFGILNYDTVTVGPIDFIVTTATGRNYISAPEVVILDEDIFQLRIPDGAGGFLGKNADVNVGLLANNVITSLKVVDHGFGYTNASSVTIRSLLAKGTDASGIIIQGGLARSEGGYTGSKGFVSSDQRIHDSNKFQAFSYEVVTEEALLEYKNTLTNVNHPAGLKMFGKFQTQRQTVEKANGSTVLHVSNSESIQVQNNTFTLTGFRTTFGGSSNVSVGDQISFGFTTATINTITSNTSLKANNFSGFSANTNLFVKPLISANLALGGRIFVDSGNANVVGKDTFFDNQLKAGYRLYSNGTIVGKVASIQGHTNLTLESTANQAFSNTSNVQILHTDEPILSGNISILGPVSGSNNIVTGSHTDFVKELRAGDILVAANTANTRIGTVRTVSNSTHLVLGNNFITSSNVVSLSGVEIIQNRTELQPFQLSGEITLTHGSTQANVVGRHTEFLNELQTGDQLFLQSNNLYIGTIFRVANNNQANLTSMFNNPSQNDISDAVVIRRQKLKRILV